MSAAVRVAVWLGGLKNVAVTSDVLRARTAVILTALPVEMTAVLARLNADRSVEMIGQILCETGYFMASGGGSWRIVACEIGPGSVDTAGAVVAVTSRVKPDILMFVGIAGALKDDLRIGDVVAASEIAWTERGKWSQGGYLPRIRTISLSASLVQLARKIARDGNWINRLAASRPDARAIVGQIASGEKVSADEHYRAWLQAAFSDALAIENEGFALARAAEVHADAQRLVVRGISDSADGSKTDDGHASAADAAAAFAFELLDACGQAAAGPGRRQAPDQIPRSTVLPRFSGGPARLLDPDRGVVEFAGRTAELSGLLAWCEDDAAGRVRLVTGPGGVGKTRLALQLSLRLRELGWRCEWVGDRQESRVLADVRAVSSGRVLLVVDYAETRIGLPDMLRATAVDDGAAIRVLLLARAAGQWWDYLGAGEGAIRDLVDAAGPEGFMLSEVLDRQLTDEQQVRAAVPVFAAALGTDPPDYVLVTPQARRARVLELHAAALVAVLEWIAAPGVQVRVDLAGVLGELLRHEERFWLGSARALGLLDGPAGMTPELLRQAVAAASLLGATDQADAVVLLTRVPQAPPSVKVATWLRELYPPDPGSREWLGAIQPDRLAERLVVGQLSGSAMLAQACLTDLDQRQARRAVLLLARAATENDAAERMLSRLLPLAAQVVAEIDAPLETLVSIANAIPYPSVVLAAAHAAVTGRILNARPANDHPALRARWLVVRGQTLGQLGSHDEAFAVTQQAVDIYQQLAAKNPGRYRPDLAAGLSSLGARFSQLGRPAEALPAEQEALAIRRELAAANPDRFSPDLANSLTNLAVIMSDLGRPAESLTVNQEAADIYRELAVGNADQFRASLAISLENLAVTFSELGLLAETLVVSEEAAGIYRDLAAVSPDRYRPDLASSLSSLGVTLSDLGRPAEGLPIVQEAAGIYSELAAGNADRFRADLATSLANLAVTFSELGLLTETLVVSEEAVGIYRDLAAVSPDRYWPDLASMLSNHGIWLSRLDRSDEALLTAQEAVGIYRQLVQVNPDRFRPGLAASLSNLGVRFLRLGRPAEALPAEEEAARIYREVVTVNPGRYQADLITSLSNVANTLTVLGRHSEARQIRAEAGLINHDRSPSS